ncbi:uncharacterized protein LAESUDRAFT_747896 [Laetiporus sulphureus 93-53]|uniref:TOG domain-containing protein n=1 Tax=Laetiporus sulphureus 93-53 TaxID=1314785 RepID=A0A165G6A7_9APHY|nr:uncharacterized protein LAESUDRAFT_747896 [Laetiporus sulphureus 93-53]KZT09885.1 hypothetical protein LAESUDRAFT_747896 [Laetiporus sulphureus 93-53]
MAPKKIPSVIQCDSLAAYEYELESLRDTLSLPESEDTWDRISASILHLTALMKGNAARFPNETTTVLRSLSRPLNSAANSERSRLSGVALEFMNVVVTTMERYFDALIPIFFPTLLGLCSRSNKVFSSRARSCVLAVVQHSRSPSVLPFLAESAKDKSVTLRQAAVEAALACLSTFTRAELEKEPRAREIEALIRSTATDANADVRKTGRKVFEAYKVALPTRVDRFTQPLTPTIRKYLDIKQTAASGTRAQPPSRPPSAQSLNAIQTKASAPTLPFSSSTSALPPKTSSSHSTQQAGVRARVLSSSNLNNDAASSALSRHVAQRAAANAAAAQDSAPKRPTVDTLHRSVASARREMPPPDTIPIRPKSVMESTRPQRHISGPSRPGNVSGPSRPLSQHDIGTVHLRTGPMRQTSTNATSSNPPARQELTERRVVGGARRVLLVPTPPEISTNTTSDPDRERGPTVSSTPVPNAATSKSEAHVTQPLDAVGSSTSEKLPSKVTVRHKPSVPKANEKAKQVPPKTAVSHRPDTARSQTNKVKSSSRGEDPKPRPPSRSHQAAPRKAASKTNTRIAIPPVTEAAHEEVVVAAEIPLPPSPTSAEILIPVHEPTSIPLPSSPTVLEDTLPSPPETPKAHAKTFPPPEISDAREEAPPPPSEVPETREESPPPQSESLKTHQGEATPCSPSPQPSTEAQAEVPVEPATPERTPTQAQRLLLPAQTPISSLVADIERGFLFTPFSPVPPPEPRGVPALPHWAPLRSLNSAILNAQRPRTDRSRSVMGERLKPSQELRTVDPDDSLGNMFPAVQ